jgi:tetratricopeptide (TPR) repeat protein
MEGDAMQARQWLNEMRTALDEIRTNFPGCPAQERPKWRTRLQELKKTCDEWLQAWAYVEEGIQNLLSEQPELEADHKEIEEDFWLRERTVRQFREGQGYYKLAMFKEARSLFQEVVEDEPEFLLGRLYLGLSHFQEGRWEEARRQFHMVRLASSHDLFIAFADHMQGCIAVKEGDDHQAIRFFSRVVSRLPEHADAWFNMGACHYRTGETKQAIHCFYQVLSLDEDDWETMAWLSRCYWRERKWESASFWRMAAFEKTRHPRMMEAIAHDLEEIGEHEQALDWYRRLLRLDAKCLEAYHGIAWNLWALKQEQEAWSWLKKGLTLAPRHPELLFACAWFSVCEGNVEKAERLLELVPEDWRRQPQWLSVRSRLSVQRGDWDAAGKAAEELIRQDKGSVQAIGHYHKGRVLLEMGRVHEALVSFEEAHRLVEDWRDPLFFAGVCHLLEGRPDLTRTCWNKMAAEK